MVTCVFLADCSTGDKRVAGCSSQRGGHPLLQPLPRPEPGAPHAAAHNHTQHIHLQTLSKNGTTSPPVFNNKLKNEAAFDLQFTYCQLIP